MFIKILGASLLTLSLAGCATWRTETKVEEAAYQASHGLDTMQTINIGKSGGRFYEDESAKIIGREPRVGPTLAYMGGIAAAHAGITAVLVDHGAPAWLVRTWELGTLSWSASHVSINFSHGIAP